MSNSRRNMLAGECAKDWCSKNNVPFTCFVSPWFGSLELLVDYDYVERQNAHKACKEWFWFFGYSNGSMAVHWAFDLFINISDSSKYKGAVIVRVSGGKFLVYSYRTFYIFEGIKRKLKYAKHSEIPDTQFGSIESNRTHNYYIADDVKYEKSHKCEGQLLDENLRGLIDQARETKEERGRMHHYQFHVPAIEGLLADLVDGLGLFAGEKRALY
ncbi:hypothetical protein BGZ83_005804 [Gryganskiella cystojenkinii]|nr:hypothetical protein BGZ83_005804 [Gryganskiella cystojenkinii]